MFERDGSGCLKEAGGLLVQVTIREHLGSCSTKTQSKQWNIVHRLESCSACCKSVDISRYTSCDSRCAWGGFTQTGPAYMPQN